MSDIVRSSPSAASRVRAPSVLRDRMPGAEMQTARTVLQLRGTLDEPRRAGHTIGLVPTMGALHAGHLSLIDAARAQCDLVVMSLFVNPAQFDESADLERYPRAEQRDLELARDAGVDVLFAPSVQEVYPAGFATAVEVLGLTERLEGAARGAEHFRGVTTVVTKLLCMAMPDVAFFGQKDAQQLAVIRRLVCDLNLAVRIAVCPTVREPSGLALSSRNSLLSDEQRERALALPAALRAARERAESGERAAGALLGAARSAMLAFEVEPEYLELVDPDTFEPQDALASEALLALAARIGDVRLIDNTMLAPAHASRPSQPLPRKVPA